MKIAYVGPFSFPSSNANSLRVNGLAEALAMAGHEIQIVSAEKGTGCMAPTETIHFHCVNEFESGFLAGLHRGLRGLFLGDITLHWLQSLQRKPDVIILYGTHLGYLLRMLFFCKKYGIPLFLDVVEWYDPRHLAGGLLGPFAIANELSMRFVAKRVSGMFTISRYLQEHFVKQGCRTLRVPPLFSSPQARPQQFRESNQRLNLCYAGSPGKKEDMKSLFTGLQMACNAGIRFTMHIVGITADQFSADYRMRSLPIVRDNGFLKFYGRVDNAEARRIVASCDFMVLLRKNIRVAKAGFPSKVAESLSLGTPIIANLSSNLDEYLIDGENSIIVKKLEAEAFCDALRRVAKFGEHEYKKMQSHALDCSNTNFKVENHAAAINEFIGALS